MESLCQKTFTNAVQKAVKAPNLMAYSDGEVDNLGELAMYILHYFQFEATAYCEAISDGKYQLIIVAPDDKDCILQVNAWDSTEDFANRLYEAAKAF